MPHAHQRSSRIPGLLLAVVVSICVLWPAAAITWTILHGALEHIAPKEVPPQLGAGSALETLPPLSLAPSLPLLAQTLAWAFGIGIIATLFAWPAAWVIRRRGWSVVGLLCVPLLLPTYLCYSAYGILRSPGWFIGNWLEELAKAGWTSAPMLAGRVIAALGLSLWAWPIAAIVLGAAVKGLDSSMLDALRLDASPFRRRLQTLFLCRAGILGAIGAVALIMLGSAVPLQLAQVSTYAIKVWLDLTLAPGSWRVWAAAWPLVVIALLAGWAIGSKVLNAAAAQDESSAPPPPQPSSSRHDRARTTSLASSLIWAASVIVPLLLFAISLCIVNRQEPGQPSHIALALDQWRAVPRFFKLLHESLTGSLMVSSIIAVIAAFIAAATWQQASPHRATRRLPLFTTRALIIAGLIPGVLIGSAFSAAANQLPGTASDALLDSPLILILAHTARFGLVPALIGVWLAAIEPRQERELRTLDGALTFKGWALACLPFQSGALIAAALATAALSLHEIEAAVVLQPPGSPSLAQYLLNELHQLRMQDLSAAGVVLVTGGLLVAGAAALGVWITGGKMANGK